MTTTTELHALINTALHTVAADAGYTHTYALTDEGFASIMKVVMDTTDGYAKQHHSDHIEYDKHIHVSAFAASYDYNGKLLVPAWVLVKSALWKGAHSRDNVIKFEIS